MTYLIFYAGVLTGVAVCALFELAERSHRHRPSRPVHPSWNYHLPVKYQEDR